MNSDATVKIGNKEVKITNRVFTLAQHPEDLTIFRSFSGSLYRMMPDGSLRSLQPPTLSKRARAKLKRKQRRNFEQGG